MHSVKVQPIYTALLEAFRRLGVVLRSSHGGGKSIDKKNDFGDIQLDTDVKCEAIIFEELKKTGLVSHVLSEETPKLTSLGPEDAPFIVTFDPLDGSSIIGANWTVGSIVGIWRNDESKLIGKTGYDQVGACCSLYGSRTSALLLDEDHGGVDEYTYIGEYNSKKTYFVEAGNKWEVTRKQIKIKPQGNVFAPGNLRAVGDNLAYKQLVDYWIANGYTLRYSGGMVPDIYQLFIKQQGVFTTLSSQKHLAKLRYLYEVAPLSLLVEKAGGKTSIGSEGSVLDQIVGSYDQKSQIAVGSQDEISRIVQFYKEHSH